ncbi:DUF222 domain-containing protein [Microbacterium sp. A196]|uniref:DUF222 domain-containing protein n=1 Tax=Microbacterium sp. A196 TaxID=3457320 RepID=UPI003FCFF614
MALFDDVAALIPTLRGCGADVGDADCARASIASMSDAEVLNVLAETAALAKQVEQVQMAAAGVIAMRSSRERGHSGLSATQGHRSAASLIQDVTGSTKAEANRAARVGEALIDGAAGSDGAVGWDGAAERGPWFQPLRDAMRDGQMTSAQFDAIRRGLGEPPEAGAGSGDEMGDRAAWAQAARQLVGEAGQRTVEELAQAARTIRDMLDPEGAEARFLARYENRSFRIYRGQDGQKRASIAFDDEGEVFVETMMAAVLRPRRGGPRFVDPDEKARAASLIDDPRTNDQLAYDLIIDVLRTGTLADAESVFGTRQAGVRLVQVVDADGAGAPVVHTEDHLISMPAAVAEQHVCDSGIVSVTLDPHGNPLNVGREQRLFTPRQRIALAIRDGGCRWRGCDRPASYCEAHHIDEWDRDHGRTDIDRGILLCRYHHMTLHQGGWRISRRQQDDFALHHPTGESFTMRPRTALSYAWGGIDPPAA